MTLESSNMLVNLSHYIGSVFMRIVFNPTQLDPHSHNDSSVIKCKGIRRMIFQHYNNYTIDIGSSPSR